MTGFDALTPVWHPLRPAQLGNRFFCFSPKLMRTVKFSSRLEFERWLQLEFDASVVTFCEQPAIAKAYIDGKIRHSRLDFWVRLTSGEEYFEEVKYISDLKDIQSRAHRQIKVQAKWCLDLGVSHRVITDEVIWRNPILMNSLYTLMKGYGGSFVHVRSAVNDLSNYILKVICDRPLIRVHEVMVMLSEKHGGDVTRLAVFELVRKGQVDAEQAILPFTPRSRLTVLKN